jgi:hypothetical protein
MTRIEVADTLLISEQTVKRHVRWWRENVGFDAAGID